jgi:spore coat protein U-like protein
MKKISHVCAIRQRVVALGVGLWAASTPVLGGSCAVGSTGLAFGSYQPLTFAGKMSSTDKTSTATVSVLCTGIDVGGSYTISLGAGTYGPGNRISTRYLYNTTSSGDYMAFNAYTEGSYNTVWGNETAGSVLSGNIPTGSSSQTHTVYGKVPAGQNTLKPGSFADSLVMTITYVP